MPERVIVQIEEPTPWREGSVTEGYYVVDGNKLTMTYATGEPVKVDDNNVERLLTEGEDPRLVAGRLTRELRRTLSGKSAVQEIFSRSIDYRPQGYA